MQDTFGIHLGYMYLCRARLVHVGAGADYNGVSEALGWGDVVFVNTIHPNRAQRTVKLSPVFSSLEKTELSVGLFCT